MELHYRGPREPSKQGHSGSKTGARLCATFRMSAGTQQTTSGSLQEVCVSGGTQSLLDELRNSKGQ